MHSNVANFRSINISDDGDFGYFVEVDLKYPETLHDVHKDLPFCAEHMASPGSKQYKLMTKLHDKHRYVLHYRALKQALKHGLVLDKVHRAIQFKQSPWLKQYIDINNAKRKEAKNEFEKMLFKLFNNAVYGKTMENERKRDKKLSDLPRGAKLMVTQLKYVTTKYGRKVVAELDSEFEVFFPKRVSSDLVQDEKFFELADAANKYELFLTSLNATNIEFSGKSVLYIEYSLYFVFV